MSRNLQSCLRAKPSWLTGSLLTMLCCLMLQACSSLPTSKPLTPTVELQDIRPLKLSLRKQEIEFRLLVQNPNDFDLPLQALDFTASLAGEALANGVTNERVNIPAEGSAVVAVIVNAGLGKFVRQYLMDIKRGSEEVGYEVTGSVKLANWPSRIPFNVDGELQYPELDRLNDG